MYVVAKLLKSKEDAKVDLSLSVSKAKTFDDCKAKFRFAYIEKLPRIDRDFHIFGKYLHQILENFHGALIADPSLKNDWKSILESSVNSAFEEYVQKLTTSQVTEASNIIKEYSILLEEDGLPNVLSVEKEFYINLNDKVLLNGFIDRIQVDSDGVLHVVDYKTTKDAKYLKDYFQLQTYAYALMLADPSIERIRGSFVMLRHGFQFLTEEWVREDINPVAEKFLKYAENINTEKTWRPTPQFLCKYCDYLDHCDSGHAFLVKRGVLEKKVKVGLISW
jgi:RecB family exonuclease